MKSTILIVDDSGTNIDILIGLFGDEYDIVVATNGHEALEIVNEEEIDLILLDIMMPKLDGYEVCKKLKQNQTTENIPVIFVTAKNDEDSIEKAYEVGGVDYVTKPFKAKELEVRIKTQLKLKQSLKELQFLASMDTMTGIYNRRKFFEFAKEVMKQVDENYYVVMVDLDHFKLVNDTYGHHIGDEILKKAVHVMKNALNDNEFIGRLGGEEFAVMMYCPSREVILQRLEDIRQEIETTFLIIDEQNKINITASFGVMQYEEGINNIDKFLTLADKRLYKAKEKGRNLICFSDN